MRFLLFVMGVVLGGWLVHLLFPWWSVVVLCAVLGWVFRASPLMALLAAFLGVFLLWAGYAAILNYYNEGILSARMGKVFGGIPALALVPLTGLLGGLLGGLAAFSTALWRREITSAGVQD